MKVAVEARALAASSSGVKTYVQQLVDFLSEAAPNDTFNIVSKRPMSDLLLPIWLETALPREMAKGNPDVVHYTKAAVPKRKVATTVVTIYDVIPNLFPESQRPLARALWPSILKNAVTRADQIVTISHASKKDIVDRLQVDPEKINVIQLAAPRVVYPEHGHEPGDPHDGRPYILYLGTIEPRKNIPALIRAFAKIADKTYHRLVIAGRIYKGSEDIKKAIEASGLQARIELIGEVSTEKKDQLYADADLFVYPSIYEGWGLPPQEALLAGTPAIVSDGGSLGEVGADVIPFTSKDLPGRLSDAAFEDALSARMFEITSDRELHDTLAQSGKEHVKQRSWLNVAEETVKVYRKAHEG